MQIVPLASSCGVEITGVQLADAAGATLDDVREAVYAHGVAVLRGQELSPQEHIAFAQRWGADSELAADPDGHVVLGGVEP